MTLEQTKMKVTKSAIPPGSLVENYAPADYLDAYACVVDSTIEMIPDDIMVRFWTDFPSWVKVLFKLRPFHELVVKSSLKKSVLSIAHPLKRTDAK
jgi:hypothetical protein